MSPRRPPSRSSVPSARAVALQALSRIEDEGAYANLALPAALDRSGLSERDRALATELVYGTTRMRRACDWLVDRFLVRDPEPEVRRALRLGAYQLQYLNVPDHAAVSETVSAAPKRARSLVNAVLRKVAAAGPVAPHGWPSAAVRLSYPDWIVDRLVDDLGEADALAALETMNEAPAVHVRPDGYVQDPASRWVGELVGAQPGDVVVDLCAGPGGKATALAATGAAVVATDLAPGRARLVAGNARRTGAHLVGVVAADGRQPPLRPGTADRVLVDAPCSGLGVLRRRPDARWRIDPAAVDALAALQRDLLRAAAALARPGGLVAYSVCTLTAAETVAIDGWAAEHLAGLAPLERPGEPWEPAGRGGRLLPQRAGTDGMFLVRFRRAGPGID